MSNEIVQKTLQELDKLLVEAINEHHLPGLAVGIIQDGSLVYAKGFGYSDIEKQVPVTPETIFRIGSISKTFTTAGIMQLYEQGRLGLDDPVNNYLKTYQVLHKDPHAPPVTFRHLITHTSGIGAMRSLLDIFKPEMGLGAKPEDPEMPLGMYYKGLLRPELYPGQKMAYANHAYATLGQLVEDISGQSLGEYMTERVFEPLGMKNSDYFLSERVQPGLAKAYNFKKGKFLPVKYLRIEVPGAGSIFSSVNDMAKYVAALMNQGANEHGRLVSPETFELMLTPQLSADPHLGFDVGLYFVITHYGKHRIIWHNGGWPGFVSAMYVAPDDKLGVVVFTNTTSMAPDLIAMKVLRQLLDEPDPISLVPVKGVLEAPHDWRRLCGFYGPKPGFLTNLRIWMGMGGEVEIFVKENHLAIRTLLAGTRKATALYRAETNDPYCYKGIQGKTVSTLIFKENEQGQVGTLLFGTSELYKRPFKQSLKLKVLSVAGSLGTLILFLLGRRLCQRRKPK